MNNDKLLRALINALGYEVEENQEQISCTCRHNALTQAGQVNCPACCGIGYRFVTDYKVTKKVKPHKLSQNEELKDAISRMGRQY